MRKKFLAAILVLGIFTLHTPSSFAAYPRVSLPVPQTAKFDQGSATLVPPTSNSSGAWSVEITDPTIATAKGLVVTILKSGTTGVTYTQAASGTFSSVSRVSRFTVEKGIPTVGTFAPITATLLSRTIKLTAPTSTSTAPWSYRSSDSKIATISSNNATFLDAGTITITAIQSASSNWEGTEVSTTLRVTSLPRILGTFTNIMIAKDSVLSLNLIEPTSSSPGAWTFTIANSSIASLYGKVLTPLNIGTTTITAFQAASGGFGSSTLKMTLTILGATATVGDFKDVTYVMSSTSSNTLSIFAPTSNSPGTWSFSSSDTSVGTISVALGNVGNIRVFKPGNTTITASQAVSGNYGATTATLILTVSGNPTYSAIQDLQKVVGDGEQTVLPPTSTSAGAWTYTSSDPEIVAISGSKLIFGNAGSATITMTQAASEFWLSGTLTFKVNVLGTTPTVGALPPVSVEVDQTLLAIPNPPSSSTGKWVYTITDPTIAKVVNNTIVGVSVGSTTIIATQSPGGKYGQSNSVQSIITVVPATIKATPTPTPKASATPKPKATPSTSTTSKPVVKVKVKKKKKVIRIAVTGSIVKVKINGKKGKLGKNKVKSGPNTVVVRVGSTIIFNKTYRIP